MSLASRLFCLMCTKGDKAKNKGLTTPDDIERFDNILYGSDRRWNLLDVYRPKARKEKLPTIVSIHGGGWVYGDKELYQYYCMSLAQGGFCVVNFNYRLAPKYKFPAGLEDMNQVMKFIIAHAGEYGIDKDNIFFVGDSAGAQMAALYTCICTNSEYAEKYDFKVPENFVPKALALNCGVYDLCQHMEEAQDMPKMLKGLVQDYLGKDRMTQEFLAFVSPTEYITKDFPPTFVMTSTGDFLIEQPKHLLKVLEENNIHYEYVMCGTEDVKLGHVFHLEIKSEDAQRINACELDFFHKHVNI